MRVRAFVIFCLLGGGCLPPPGVSASDAAVADFDPADKGGASDLHLLEAGVDGGAIGSPCTLPLECGSGSCVAGRCVAFPVGLPALKIGKYMSGIAAADMDGDKIVDLVVSTSLGSSDVEVLFGLGAGKFAPPRSYPAGGGQSSLAISDFNGDGRMDIAVGSSIPDTEVRILNGEAARSFRAPVRYGVAALNVPDSPTGIVAVDIDRDGLPELAVVSIDRFVNIFHNKNGVLEKPAALRLNVEGGGDIYDSRGVSVGDFDSSGKVDFVVMTAGDGVLLVFDPDLSGRFRKLDRFFFKGETIDREPVVSDIDGDGKVDIAYVVGPELSAGDRIRIQFGHGDGTFSAAWALDVPEPISGLAVLDVNNDGRLDLVIPTFGKHPALLAFAGSGGRTFKPLGGYGIGEYGKSTVADLNGDGRMDIAFVDYATESIVIWFNRGMW